MKIDGFFDREDYKIEISTTFAMQTALHCAQNPRVIERRWLSE